MLCQLLKFHITPVWNNRLVMNRDIMWANAVVAYYNVWLEVIEETVKNLSHSRWSLASSGIRTILSTTTSSCSILCVWWCRVPHSSSQI
jgi:hypothetical protein